MKEFGIYLKTGSAAYKQWPLDLDQQYLKCTTGLALSHAVNHVPPPFGFVPYMTLCIKIQAVSIFSKYTNALVVLLKVLKASAVSTLRHLINPPITKVINYSRCINSTFTVMLECLHALVKGMYTMAV